MSVRDSRLGACMGACEQQRSCSCGLSMRSSSLTSACSRRSPHPSKACFCRCLCAGPGLRIISPLAALPSSWCLSSLHGEAQVTRVPIEDFNGEELVRLVKEGARAVDRMYRDAEARGQKPKIYIHCTAGMGRAPGM